MSGGGTRIGLGLGVGVSGFGSRGSGGVSGSGFGVGGVGLGVGVGTGEGGSTGGSGSPSKRPSRILNRVAAVSSFLRARLIRFRSRTVTLKPPHYFISLPPKSSSIR